MEFDLTKLEQHEAEALAEAHLMVNAIVLQGLCEFGDCTEQATGVITIGPATACEMHCVCTSHAATVIAVVIAVGGEALDGAEEVLVAAGMTLADEAEAWLAGGAA